MTDYSVLSRCLECIDAKKAFASYKSTGFCFEDMSKMSFTEEVITRYTGMDCLALFLEQVQEGSSLPYYVWILIALGIAIFVITLAVKCYTGEEAKVKIKAVEATKIAKGVVEDLGDLSFISGHPYYRCISTLINSCSKRCKKNKKSKKNILPTTIQQSASRKKSNTQTPETPSDSKTFLYSTPNRSPRPADASKNIRKNRLYPQISHLALIHSTPVRVSPV